MVLVDVKHEEELDAHYVHCDALEEEVNCA